MAADAHHFGPDLVLEAPRDAHGEHHDRHAQYDPHHGDEDDRPREPVLPLGVGQDAARDEAGETHVGAR